NVIYTIILHDALPIYFDTEARRKTVCSSMESGFPTSRTPYVFMKSVVLSWTIAIARAGVFVFLSMSSISLSYSLSIRSVYGLGRSEERRVGKESEER